MGRKRISDNQVVIREVLDAKGVVVSKSGIFLAVIDAVASYR